MFAVKRVHVSYVYMVSLSGQVWACFICEFTRVIFVHRGSLQYILNMFHFSRFDRSMRCMTFVLRVCDTYGICATVLAQSPTWTGVITVDSDGSMIHSNDKYIEQVNEYLVVTIRQVAVDDK